MSRHASSASRIRACEPGRPGVEPRQRRRHDEEGLAPLGTDHPHAPGGAVGTGDRERPLPDVRSQRGEAGEVRPRVWGRGENLLDAVGGGREEPEFVGVEFGERLTEPAEEQADRREVVQRDRP
ncbi:hypothetical protein [Actinocorallia sp. A-T 12471]|uniref:hypothetical protein n=1 Tax=Actinocorallia sp. A-T 12471 TaxID=3089813 RepID=UPI0029D1E388|nr:hypothetical protein [Actinocorallia sp. A-T 12471]MDX6740668.1 hypothetical protein [Actinocorallia sp. A-T 12471]